MSLYIDVKYLQMLSPKLEGFVQKKPELWNCRCMICHDSKKKKSKKRGFFYVKNNNIFYRCFNCEFSTTLYKLMEIVDPFLAKEYTFEKFTTDSSKHSPSPKPKIEFKKPVFEKTVKLNIPAISDLDDKHFAKKYVLDRKIPKGSHRDLFYASDFRKFVYEIYPECKKDLIENEERLIIPFRDFDGNIFAFQGRSFGSSGLRYITIKMKDELKLFGLDKVNRKEKILVVEGPLDALFLKNAVATADANLAIAEFLGKDKIVLVNDNEPRNPHIVKQIRKYIDNGFKVCLFPDTVKFKDINEMVLGGYSKPQIHRIIDENTFEGLRAEIEFNKWKKC